MERVGKQIDPDATRGGDTKKGFQIVKGRIKPLMRVAHEPRAGILFLQLNHLLFEQCMRPFNPDCLCKIPGRIEAGIITIGRTLPLQGNGL
ncbi:MAG: hypothetical protein R3E50_13675 [Halioglobus sp.]